MPPLRHEQRITLIALISTTFVPSDFLLSTLSFNMHNNRSLPSHVVFSDDDDDNSDDDDDDDGDGGWLVLCVVRQMDVSLPLTL